jgi:hypothetical protein
MTVHDEAVSSTTQNHDNEIAKMASPPGNGPFAIYRVTNMPNETKNYRLTAGPPQATVKVPRHIGGSTRIDWQSFGFKVGNPVILINLLHVLCMTCLC